MEIKALLSQYLSDNENGKNKLKQLRQAITEALNDEQDYASTIPEWKPVRLLMRDDKVGGGYYGDSNKPIHDLSQCMAYIKDQNEKISEQVNAGFILVSSFEDGATLTLSNEVLLYEADGQYYRWTGDLPKIVDVNSTPDSSGGIGGGSWILVGDGTLRKQLQLENSGFLVDDSNIKFKRNNSNIIRTYHEKNNDVLNVKDFGCIGDGFDHPLSELYETLEEAKQDYYFITSLEQTIDFAGIQLAIITAKNNNSSVFIPSGVYIINSTINIDYAVSIYGEGGQGLRDISSSHLKSDVKGTLLYSKVRVGYAISIAPRNYTFGLQLRDFALWGIDGLCDKGMYLDHVGWMGIVENINIQFFLNEGLVIGYIQDTYFNNCSFVHCGNVNKYAIVCKSPSNYVYFDKCHFELTAYMLDIDNCYFWNWSRCHFEVARPIGDNVSADDRFFYTASCINLNSSYRLTFTDNVFIPVDIDHLACKNGVPRDSVPYFMAGQGDYISFTGNIWFAPEGSIDVAHLTGTQIHFINCQFIKLSPSRPSLYIKHASVIGCTFGIQIDADTSKLYGVKIETGSFANNTIGFIGADNKSKRIEGLLVSGSAFCSSNEYQQSSSVFKYLDKLASVKGNDGGGAKYVDITSTGDIDLELLHPATHLKIENQNVVISNISGVQNGRELMVFSNYAGSYIKFAENSVLTMGLIDYSLPQYHSALFKAIDYGIVVLMQIK
ncbi:hypothetical protein RCS94_03430 [Orbaceae bacterium ac157xtp]